MDVKRTNRDPVSSILILDEKIKKAFAIGSYKHIIEVYKDLKEAKCMDVFQAKVTVLADFVASTSCHWRKSLHLRSRCPHLCLIYGVLMECFLRQFDDSDIVASFIRCLDHHITPLNIVGITRLTLLGLKASTAVEGERQRCEPTSLSFLTYCLYHASKNRLTFNDEHFIRVAGFAVPTYANVYPVLWVGKIVLPLLQYGARLPDKNKICESYLPEIFVRGLLNVINRGACGKYWDRTTLSLLVKPSEMDESVKDACACFCALLRDTMNPQEITCLLAGRVNCNSRIPDLEILVPFYDKVFEGYNYGRRSPSSLRHMCRYVIRSVLFENWALPAGISSLPVPLSIQDYVNLLYD